MGQCRVDKASIPRAAPISHAIFVHLDTCAQIQLKNRSCAKRDTLLHSDRSIAQNAPKVTVVWTRGTPPLHVESETTVKLEPQGA